MGKEEGGRSTRLRTHLGEDEASLEGGGETGVGGLEEGEDEADVVGRGEGGGLGQTGDIKGLDENCDRHASAIGDHNLGGEGGRGGGADEGEEDEQEG